MNNSSLAVQQAVDLLLARHKELSDELAEITAALTALGVRVDKTATTYATPSNIRDIDVAMRHAPPRVAQKASVRAVVADLLRRENRPWSTDEIAGAIRSEYPDTDDDRFRANVRSALYQMKESGDALKVARGVYLAAQWLPPNVEGPEAGTSGPSIPNPTSEEGGGASGTDTHRVRDDHSSWKAEHLDHDLGAPVVGA